MAEEGSADKQEERKPLEDFVANYKWMIRPCSSYNTEYTECASLKGRFYQLYIDGETADCRDWKSNYRDCKNFTKDNDLEAAKRIIIWEDARRKARVKAHFANDVWEQRTEPPPHWNAPLPEWMTEYHQHSFLQTKQDALENNPYQAKRDEKKWCRMM